MGALKEKTRGWFWYLIVIGIVALVVTAAVISIKKKKKSSDETVPTVPGAIDAKYGEAFKISLQFFDIQKSGKLVDNPITWRGDSALKDGSDVGADLSKGMYDAGDHIKFGLPMAFTATILSWAILEYGDQMNAAKDLGSAQDSLKWITDYLINAHPSKDVLYIQVGDPNIDHGCWERPEVMTEKRPVIEVNKTSPGTEVAAETAAALAAASLVFKKINSTYSDLLLKHAQQLFTFADTYRGSYSVSIPEVQKYYNSTGYGDELIWSAAWLYHATGDETYLNYVTFENGNEFAGWGKMSWFSWDNKLAGAQVLLARTSFFGSLQASGAQSKGIYRYRLTAEAVMCALLPDSPNATPDRTDGGLLWISEWNALQHPVASAFLVVVFSDYMFTSRTKTLECSGTSFKPSDLRNFAKSQADYVLGDNPMKMSYLVGYGKNYPQKVHHRGASIPADATTGCKNGWNEWLDAPGPNPNVAMGALVGGPFKNGSFIDDRNNSMQAEPTTYNSAIIVGLLSGLVTTSTVAESLS